MSAQRRAAADLTRRLNELFRELGRKVSEDESFQWEQKRWEAERAARKAAR